MSSLPRHPTQRPFDLEAVLDLVREAALALPRPALFALAESGFASPFELVVACVISIRTLDEVSEPTARELFRRARTPAKMAALGAEEVDGLIRRSTFHEAKARQIVEIARRASEEFGGELPCDDAVLRSLPGVGPKCANLTLGIACGVPRIAVDVHVHQVVNRWGYVQTKTPEQTVVALEARVPERHWIELNRLLMPFGKHICTSRLPHCSTCPVREYCPRVGVTASR